jgi:hypothetical protein
MPVGPHRKLLPGPGTGRCRSIQSAGQIGLARQLHNNNNNNNNNRTPIR